MGLLDVLLRKVVQIAGVSLTERKYWNFVSGATAVDNPATGATDITLAAGGAPGGTTTEVQYRSGASTFGGLSVLKWDAGASRVVASSSGFEIANPAATFGYYFISAAIAADRSITLPLLAGNDIAVMEAFAQPLTNKTIVAASNTITDTSAALGDLFRWDGTRFARFARGSALQAIRVNAGGTDIEYAAAASTSPGGSDTYVQFNDSSAFGGDSGLTYVKATDALTVAGSVAIGASPRAAVGLIRVKDAAGTVMSARNVTDSGDKDFIVTATGSVTFGNNDSNWVNVYLRGGSGTSANVHGYNVDLYAFNAAGCRMSAVAGSGILVTGTLITSAHPIHGEAAASSPWGVHGKVLQIDIGSLASLSLSAAQYAMGLLRFVGDPTGTNCTVTLPTPANDAASYPKTVDCDAIVSTDTVTFTIGSGTTVAVTGGAGTAGAGTRRLWFSPAGVSYGEKA